MLFSLNWIKEFVDIGDIEVDSLCEKLTNVGLKVENVVFLSEKSKLSKVIAGKVVEIQPIPESTKLKLCKVFTGKEVLSIVCGADNVEVNKLYPLALEGAILPRVGRIERKKIMGVLSEGMLCSSYELGLDDDSQQGLFTLPDDTPVGAEIPKLLELDDVILDIEILHNRADCLSHLGIAREIAAIENVKIKALPIAEDIFSFSEEPVINITFCDKEISHRYMGVEIYGVEIKESPLWLKNRLRNCGCRPINNIVDVTNYILLGLGQPLHAFDLDKIHGKEIQIRFSKEDEEIYCLDGKERLLDNNIPVIADKDKPIALAGIIGGEDSSVSVSTKNVFIECAHFVPSVIYSAMKKMNLLTEASLRFSRGVDIVKLGEALHYAVTLIFNIEGAKKISKFIDIRNVALTEKRTIAFPMKEVERYLGVRIEKEDVKNILRRLNFVVDDKGEILDVSIPSYRGDVADKVDLIEEVARLHGYDAIPMRPFNVYIVEGYRNKLFDVCSHIRNVLEGLGFHEIITYGFISQKDIEVFNLREVFTPIELVNPISEEFSVLRPSLVPSMVKVISHNNKFKQHNLMLYEIGRVFFKEKDRIEEFSNLCISISGRNVSFETWLDKGFEFDYYALVGYMNVLFEKLNLHSYSILPEENSFFSEGESFAIYLGDEKIGFCGVLDEKITKYYELSTKVYTAELVVDKMLEEVKLKAKKFKEIDKYLPVRRDLSLVVPEKVKFSDIRKVIMKNIDTSKKLEVKLYVFDVYKADILPKGTYGLSVRLEFHFKEALLQSSEVNEITTKIANALGEELSIKLREK
mgnify:CR=1 FL=1